MNCKERLTIKYGGDFLPKKSCIFNRNGEVRDFNDCVQICEKSYDECSKCPIQKCFDRLGELEDKLENGTLIELPCKVGDTVYRLDTDTNYIEPMVIENMVIDSEDIILRYDSYDGVICHLSNIIEQNSYLGCFFVFLTKEETEARLKELKENGNV